MTRHSKVFVPVSVDENMPPLDKIVSVSFDNGERYSYEAQGKGWKANEVNYSHWLEEKENVYVLSEQELLNLLGEFSYEIHKGTYDNLSVNYAAAKKFLQSKTNPQTENK